MTQEETHLIITTVRGKEIDVSEWVAQMRENHALGRDILEQTPIAKTADGYYFWWDEEGNPTLNKKSVQKLIETIKS